MKQLLSLFLLTCIISAGAYCQPDTGFAAQRKLIDAQTLATDSNKALTQNLLNGDLLWGKFQANCYFTYPAKAVAKTEYFFENKAAGKKTFYYSNDNLVKINDNGVIYYYLNRLFDKDGRPVNRSKEEELLFFSQESKKLVAQVF